MNGKSAMRVHILAFLSGKHTIPTDYNGRRSAKLVRSIQAESRQKHPARQGRQQSRRKTRHHGLPGPLFARCINWAIEEELAGYEPRPPSGNCSGHHPDKRSQNLPDGALKLHVGRIERRTATRRGTPRLGLCAGHHAAFALPCRRPAEIVGLPRRDQYRGLGRKE